VTESELIELMRSMAEADSFPWLKVGIGDDAAELTVGDGQGLLLTTDMVVAGVHFAEDTEPELIGRKAIARGLSDIAAMAGRPLCTVAAVNLGDIRDDSFARRLLEALWREAAALSAPLVGGDMASGGQTLTITVTAVGLPGPQGAVARSGAKAGDLVCVSGTLGGSILGRHLRFTPRIREALQLVETARIHAMIDISDGLSTDLLHIAEASGVAVRIEAEKIPVSPDAVLLSRESGREPVWHALNDGEDYELLFCAPPQDARRLAQCGVGGVPVTVIGTVTRQSESVLVEPTGECRKLRAGGWEHLRQ